MPCGRGHTIFPLEICVMMPYAPDPDGKEVVPIDTAKQDACEVKCKVAPKHAGRCWSLGSADLPREGKVSARGWLADKRRIAVLPKGA